MTTAELEKTIKELPARELRIFSLARELVGEGAYVDADRAVPRMAEIDQAEEEARAYAAATNKLTWRLKQHHFPQ